MASRQHARTQATRRRLLDAAERIIARDGFEASRIEDIASRAGYTRGAFYANFQSKEDIFFTLLERWVQTLGAELNALFERHPQPAKLLPALRRHYAEIAKNREVALLSAEFKLFAIRHPEAHRRLRARHRHLRSVGANFMGRVAKSLGRTLPISSMAAAAGLGSFSNALVLDHLVDRTGISEREIEYLLGVYFDGMFGTKTVK